MIRCPKCGSGSVKKSSAIYEQGISRSKSRSSGIWLSGRGPGVWAGRSNSERISAVAERNAPGGFELEALTFIGTFFVVLLIGFSAADSIGAFLGTVPIALVISIAAMLLVAASQKDQRAASRARYDRLWYCSRCGHQFEIDLERAGPNPQAQSADRPPSAPSGNSPRLDYASRVLAPVQRAKAETERDGAWLRMIRDRSDQAAGWSFDPCYPAPLDLGAVSRLSSLGYLQYDQARDVFSLTQAGAERATKI